MVLETTCAVPRPPSLIFLRLKMPMSPPAARSERRHTHAARASASSEPATKNDIPAAWIRVFHGLSRSTGQGQSTSTLLIRRHRLHPLIEVDRETNKARSDIQLKRRGPRPGD